MEYLLGLGELWRPIGEESDTLGRNLVENMEETRCLKINTLWIIKVYYKVVVEGGCFNYATWPL